MMIGNIKTSQPPQATKQPGVSALMYCPRMIPVNDPISVLNQMHAIGNIKNRAHLIVPSSPIAIKDTVR